MPDKRARSEDSAEGSTAKKQKMEEMSYYQRITQAISNHRAMERRGGFDVVRNAIRTMYPSFDVAEWRHRLDAPGADAGDLAREVIDAMEEQAKAEDHANMLKEIRKV